MEHRLTATRPLTCREVRQRFFAFFAAREHLFVPSEPVVQTGDPTLMFTNSGMNQFKSIFLGDQSRDLRRVYNSQKCMRVSGKHNDLDEVGSDGTHHTLFEMLGNWSFADYGKREAITWAWQFLTEDLGLDKERLFATAHPEDREAAQIWQHNTDLASGRLLFFERENFWEMGAVGPCGPSSEIFYDLGPAETRQATFADPQAGINGREPRYVEIWNLVFMQYERLSSGQLRPLGVTHVDTGSGFERLCMVVQGKTSTYETDLFAPIIAQIASDCGQAYHPDTPQGKAFRVLADHIRALVFTIADGVMPANEGHGYVLRRILRRASRFAETLGHREPYLHRLVAPVVEVLGDVYPEIAERQAVIARTIELEEARFLRTLASGLERLQKLVVEAKQDGNQWLSGEAAFLLHDTYGFPVDLTAIVCAEHGVAVDLEGFEIAMTQQRDRARAHSKFDSLLASEEAWVVLTKGTQTEFLGYTQTACNAQILRYLPAGANTLVVCDRSPFYAESGGQCGDRGEMVFARGERAAIVDTQKTLGLHLHTVVATFESVAAACSAGSQVRLQIDVARRERIRRNHSAAHLLHAALRQVLGAHVQQQGSAVDADKVRFDFTHEGALGPDQRQATEDWINTAIWHGVPVQTQIMTRSEAEESGAIALFGEKYGDQVRVLRMGPYSLELCGGTHVDHTGQIGCVKIVAESSVSAGVRRIELWTGSRVTELARQQEKTLEALCAELKVDAARLLQRVQRLSSEGRRLAAALGQHQAAERRTYLHELSRHVHEIAGQRVLCCRLDATRIPVADLSRVVPQLLESLSGGVVFLSLASGDSVHLVAGVSPQLLGQLDASALVGEIAKELGGKGGGKPSLARGAIVGDAALETRALGLAQDILATQLTVR